MHLSLRGRMSQTLGAPAQKFQQFVIRKRCEKIEKENEKFIYSVLREGARAKDFELAIQWLTDCDPCCKVSCVTKGAVPLKAYQNISAFKLYLVDVGLLAAMTDLAAKTLLKGNAIFAEFKGAFTEQFVCQQLYLRLGHHALLLVGGKLIRRSGLRITAQRERDPPRGQGGGEPAGQEFEMLCYQQWAALRRPHLHVRLS